MFQVSILSQEDTKQLLTMPEVIDAVENVYTKKAKDETTVYPMVFHEFNPGVADMDIKSGELKDDVFGLKMVSWFAENPKKNLPALIGTILICDAKTGVPMGIVDGSHITGMRTGACAAIGAKALARANSETLLMVGTGHICAYAVAATLHLMPQIKTVLVCAPITPETEAHDVASLKEKLTQEFACDLTGITFAPAGDKATACANADIIITATPAKTPILQDAWIKAGTHLSCIGADMPGKQEIDSAILTRARIFTDDTPQCMRVGEIETAINAGTIAEKDIVGEIGAVLCGTATGRTSADDITVFDATGMALLDLATAKVALQNAKETEVGSSAQL